MPEVAARPDLTNLDLESLAADVVAQALKAGATDAEEMCIRDSICSTAL